MKPREKKPQRVFRIINRKTGEAVGSYSRAYCDEFDFDSAEQARSANCYEIFKNKDEYNIAEYEVTYRLVNPNCEGE